MHMWYDCYMSETSMLRVSKHLRDLLKLKAKAEGRTLEWMADQALESFLTLPNSKNVSVNEQSEVMPIDSTKPSTYRSGGLTYKNTEDWGA